LSEYRGDRQHCPGLNFASRNIEEALVPIHRLNHAVLYVSDVERSAAFYRDVLEFVIAAPEMRFPGAAFLRAPGSHNDHDLGLFEVAGAGPSAAGRSTVGLYHLAWEVDTLAELERIARKLQETGSLVGTTDHSTTKALYGKDPDGIEFEVSWLVPADLLTDEILAGRTRNRPLDLEADKQRFGTDTLGGVGVSIASLV
jgi:catechol 2,3-dioxygenase-like lactoylglutathione lyase family enzyme